MGARQAKTPTNTTHPKIAELQMRHRLDCRLARDSSLIKPAVTLPLTSVLSATRKLFRCICAFLVESGWTDVASRGLRGRGEVWLVPGSASVGTQGNEAGSFTLNP